LNILTFAENTLDLAQTAHGDEQRFRDATEMSLGELLHPGADLINPRDAPKWRVEAHKRLSGPLTTMSFAAIALVSVLTGAFRRHGNIIRPLAAVLLVVGLLALGLAVANLAARDNALIPLIWLQAIGPGVVSAAILFLPQLLASAPRRLQARQVAAS
jgi:lipopolysaccharide export system permease protein